MNQEFVELYECEAIRALIEERVQSVTHVNRRLYINRLLFIVSRLHWKQVHHPNDFAANGAKLRTYVNAENRKNNPEDEKTTLVWYLSSKGGKVSNMIHTLEEWGIIEPKHDFIIGVSARTFTFKKPFINSPVTLRRFYLKDGAFVKKLLREKAEQRNHPLIQFVLDTYTRDITLSEEGLCCIQDLYGTHTVVTDIAAAHRTGCFEDNREDLLNALRTVAIAPEHEILMKLFKKEYYATVGPRNGRVNHILTSLPKEYRKYVLLKGQPLVGTDITNCQPALSVGLINKQLRTLYGEDYVADDMVRFEEHCRNGSFYEAVAQEAGIDISTHELRTKFKKNRFFPEVFYCPNNNWNTPTQVAFRTLFPKAEEAIRALKREDHRQFSIQLQQLESEVVVHTVFTQLVKEGHTVLPLHDAIYSNDAGVVRYAQELIRASLKEKYGVEVSFKGDDQDHSIETVPEHPIKTEPGHFSPPVPTITKHQAFLYFDNRVDRFIEHLEQHGCMDRFLYGNILAFLNKQLQDDHRINPEKRILLTAHLKEYDKERLLRIREAAEAA